MTTSTRLIAIHNVRQYNTLAMAQDVALRQKYIVDILLGDNGLFWVPATTRESGLLIKAGYERA